MKLRSLLPIVLIVALLGVIFLGGCGGNMRLISHDDEIKMGREASVQFEQQYGGRDLDPRRVSLAQSIGSRIAAVAVRSPFPNYPYEYRVLANKEVNANAFPGGLIYIWRGLYDALNYDPQQIAWVVGHETAHVARQHSVRRIERQVGYELILQLLLGKDQGGQIAAAVSGLSLQEYGRDQEGEADRVGLHFAHDAGYDPTASLQVLEAFKKLQGKDPSRLELLFSTHPGNTDRENAIKAELRKQGWTGRYFK